MTKSKKIISVLISVFIIITVVYGCGLGVKDSAKNSASTKSQNSINEDRGVNESADGNSETEKSETVNIPNDEKIIFTSDVDIETIEFDKSIEQINKTTAALGGYIENSSRQGTGINSTKNDVRTASFTLRIPKKNYQTFMNSASKFGSVTSTNSTSQNITDKYYDADAHLKALKVQEERLLELLEKAASLTDILKIEEQLSNVRYSIENLQGSLNRMDKLVEYSTVNIYLREVKEITSKSDTLSAKMSSTFSASVKALVSLFKGIVIGITAAIPFLPLIAIVSIAVLMIKRKINKNRRIDKK